MKNFKKHWKEIEENFKWNRVHNVMEYLNISWESEKVPTIDEMKTTAEKLLKKISRPESSNGDACYTGICNDPYYEVGLKAERKKYGLQLSFIIDSWESSEYEIS